MPDKKLLYVVNDGRFFLSHRANLARAARARGYEVHVAVPEDGAAGEIDAAGFRRHTIDLDRRSLSPVAAAITLRSIARLYKELRPHLVHHLTIKPVLLGGLASRLAKVPAVVNGITGLGWVFVGTGSKAALTRAGVQAGYRASFRHPNASVVFQNRDDMDLFVARRLVRGSQALVIPGSGIDTQRFTPQPIPSEDPPLVVLPARMLWDKGVGTFADAGRLLRAEGVPIRLALVGGIDPGNRSAVDEATLRGWVDGGFLEWWGHQNDMVQVYRQAAVVCLPSRREGVPLALLEAAACARPIVATNAPGCRDAVLPGRSGLLVPVDDAAALAAALTRMARDPDLRRSMGAAARDHAVEHFDQSIVHAQTLALYDRLTEERALSP